MGQPAHLIIICTCETSAASLSEITLLGEYPQKNRDDLVEILMVVMTMMTMMVMVAP